MKKYLWAFIVMCFVLGAFCIGNGMVLYLNSETEQQKKDYWLGQGAAMEDNLDPVQRDLWNRSLLENRKYLTMENHLYTNTGDYRCEARISNASGSILRCTVTVIRNSTSEILYQSKLIDPGYYIEEIEFTTKLREGYYPCTIVWSFYELEGEYIIGEMAENAVVIVQDS